MTKTTLETTTVAAAARLPAQALCKGRRNPYADAAMADDTHTDDETLMLRYCDGDSLAFEILYRRYRPLLFNYLLRQCHNRAIAEELYQDIWLKLIGARERYQPSARFKTYIFHITHNRLVDHYRRQAAGLPPSYRDPEGIEDEMAGINSITPEQAIDGQRQFDRLISLIETLPEAQREAFLLREHSGLSLEEIAEVTAVRIETAKSRLRYAFNKLRKGLELEP
jgi:RNA polymerase sigma-70 factor (ECF subfamily)